MPLSGLRRPLAVLAAAYILLLCGLKTAGFFRVEAPEAASAFLWRDGTCLEGRVASGFSPKRQGERVWVEAERLASRCPGADWTALSPPARVLAYLRPDDPEAASVLPGGKVRLDGKLRLPRQASNPGEFDEKAFLEDRGAALVFHCRAVDKVLTGPPWRRWAEAAACLVHRSVHAYLEEKFPQPSAALLEGFLLGYKGTLDKETRRVFQDSGAMHLIVPSGAKAAFVLWAALLAGAWLGLPRPWRFAAAAGAGGFYVLVVGGEPPYARAYFAALAWMGAYAMERDSSPFQGVVLSALAILILFPRDLFSAGFQMTYAAMMGLSLAVRRGTARRLPRWLRPFARLLWISFVVQIMLWPAFAAYFGRGSLAGAFANVLLVPASGFVMGSGFGAWLAHAAGWGAAEAFFACSAAASVWGCLGVCRFFAGLPFAAVDLSPMGPDSVAAYYLAAAGLLVLPRWRVSLAAWALAGVLWAFGREAPALDVLLVSQRGGRAALIRLPDGRTALLDGRIPPAVLDGILRAAGAGGVDELWLRGMAGIGKRPGPLLERLGPVRVRRWRPGERLAAGPAEVEGGEEGAVSLRWGGLAISSLPGETIVAAALPGRREEYCIMESSTKFPSESCAGGRRLSLRKDGAVRIRTDGKHVEVLAQRRPDPVGRHSI
jgi:ComEC/Rec2-related protein